MNKIISKTITINENGKKNNVFSTTGSETRESSFNDPKDLLSAAWAVCINETARFLLNKEGLKNNVKTKVELIVKKSSLDNELYFELIGYLGVENKDLNFIKNLFVKVHERCPVSKLINQNEGVKIIPILYNNF